MTFSAWHHASFPVANQKFYACDTGVRRKPSASMMLPQKEMPMPNLVAYKKSKLYLLYMCMHCILKPY